MNNYSYDICIIGGGGHIGLPLGVAFANAGQNVVLLDVNKEVLEKINSGVFPFKEDHGQEKLQEALNKGALFTSSDPEVIARSKTIITVIGTPIDEYLNPNFLGILRALENYLEYFKDEQILILRSTVYPGTSERIQRFFDKRGKKVKVAFCPERIVEGEAFEEFKTLPQLISAFDEDTLSKVSNLFSKLTDQKMIPLKPVEAELAKLFVNAWRYIEFAVANQFFMIAEEQDVDYHKVYSAMRQDYPRLKGLAKPGFAAGPCLLKDTMQLAAFNSGNFYLGHTAMLINEGLPSFIIQKIVKCDKDIHNKTIGILGMAFKPESDDQRDSLSFKLRKIAATKAKRVMCHDVYIKSDEFYELDEVLKESDIIILATPHDAYKNIRLVDYPNKKFIDVWNYWDNGFKLST